MEKSDKTRVLEVVDALLERGDVANYSHCAKKINVNPQRFTDIKLNRGKVSIEILMGLEKIFNVNTGYIKTGEGPMFKAQSNEEKVNPKNNYMNDQLILMLKQALDNNTRLTDAVLNLSKGENKVEVKDEPKINQG